MRRRTGDRAREPAPLARAARAGTLARVAAATPVSSAKVVRVAVATPLSPARAAVALLGLAAALSLAPPARAEDVRVEVSADRTELAQDEVLLVTVTVASEGAPALDLSAPGLPFSVVSQTRSASGGPAAPGAAGGRRRTTVFTLALAPRRAGALEVAPIAALVDGVRHEAAPLRVTVRPAGSRAAAPARVERRSGAWRGWERDLVLEVKLDRREVFVGEQVTATVVLRSPVGVVRYERFQPPALDGFWAEEVEVPRRLAFAVRRVGGVPTREYAVRRLALFPARPGRLAVGPFEVDVAVRLGSDALYSAFDELRRARRASAPVELRVKPLPGGAPAGFAPSNVGTWRLAVAAPERAGAGQPLAVRLTATGVGNVAALALPPLPPIAGARAVATHASEAPARAGGRLGGSRTVETVLVPEREGALEIPALAWPFFSPRTGRYEVARTSALRVQVAPGAATPPGPGPDALADRLPPVRSETGLSRPGPPPWERAPFGAAVAVPPLAFAALALLDLARARARAGAPARRARGAGARARRALAAARRTLAGGDPEGALAAAAAALSGLAADALGRPAAGATREALAAALREAGLPAEGVRALREALDACDAARFGAAAPAEEVLARAARAVDLLAPGRGRAGGAP